MAARHPGEKADVRLTASRDGGVLFTHEWSDVKFDAVYANGPFCGVDGYRLVNGPLKF